MGGWHMPAISLSPAPNVSFLQRETRTLDLVVPPENIGFHDVRYSALCGASHKADLLPAHREQRQIVSHSVQP